MAEVAEDIGWLF